MSDKFLLKSSYSGGVPRKALADVVKQAWQADDERHVECRHDQKNFEFVHV